MQSGPGVSIILFFAQKEQEISISLVVVRCHMHCSKTPPCCPRHNLALGQTILQLLAVMSESITTVTSSMRFHHRM